ncbi:MAG TPA: hypothetical protein VMU81_01505 [Acetobacteraceae bacterium]|jgi:hypothetical protein|nr:hypothetical protein [Acetobacteraceae bacterium]
MRRLAAAAVLLLALTTPLLAQRPGEPIHAFLFGEWVGGVFPPPVTLSAQECMSQPMVIFTRDSVMRASMTSAAYEQRAIESVRATKTGFVIQFYPDTSSNLPGFGCPNPDVMPVQRRGENEIAFPGCSGFPFPLVRCGSH